MLSKTPESKIITPVKTTQPKLTASNPYFIFKEPIKFSRKGVRNAIISKIKELAPKAGFTKPFTDHLLQMGSDKLDTYNKMVFILEEYNLTIEIITSRMGGDEMTYTFPENPGPPPDELMRKKFLGLF
jgi:hypothetical protein